MAEAAVYSSTTEFLMLSYDQLRALPSAAVGVAIASGLAATAMIAVATYSVVRRFRWCSAASVYSDAHRGPSCDPNRFLAAPAPALQP